MTDEATRVVVTDTCILLNLIHVDRLALLGSLPGFEFIIPDHVYLEVTESAQRKALDLALERSSLRKESLTDPEMLVQYAGLVSRLGKGEAACIALAHVKGWMIASDEGRLFRSEVIKRLGEERLLTTVGLYKMAIQAGLLTVEEADNDKAELERRRFKMGVTSFRDLVTRRD